VIFYRLTYLNASNVGSWLAGGAATIVYHSSEVTVMSLRHPFVGLKG
jgi:hypothetical protein